jgi:hypothetical protein
VADAEFVNLCSWREMKFTSVLDKMKTSHCESICCPFEVCVGVSASKEEVKPQRIPER